MRGEDGEAGGGDMASVPLDLGFEEFRGKVAQRMEAGRKRVAMKGRRVVDDVAAAA